MPVTGVIAHQSRIFLKESKHRLQMYSAKAGQRNRRKLSRNGDAGLFPEDYFERIISWLRLWQIIAGQEQGIYSNYILYHLKALGYRRLGVEGFEFGLGASLHATEATSKALPLLCL